MNKNENMTIDKKISILTGSGAFEAVKLPDTDLIGVKMADGPNGVKTQSGDSVCFMNTCLMAASWDREICKEVGIMIGREAVRCGVDLLLGPTINLKRSPLAGRNFESYSEDPYLTGILATEYIKGVKSTGVKVCLKHFACNNQESNRFVENSVVDLDTLRNIYLRAFEIVLSNVEVDAIMAAYNKINGVYACENKYLLNDILRKEWNYNGVVLSDWCAVSDIVAAMKNGLDLEMPQNLNSFPKLKTAVLLGELTEKEIDEKVNRLIKLCRERTKKDDVVKVDVEKLVNITGESFVLLKNEGILPFDKKNKVLLIGNAKNPRIQGGGCAQLKTNFLTIPYDEICKYADCCDCIDGYVVSENELSCYDKIVVFLTLPEDCDSEAYDRNTITFPKKQIDALEKIYKFNKNVVAVLSNGSAVDLSFESHVKGILETYYSGSYGAKALAKVLYGEIVPSGKLAESFPKNITDIPNYDSFGKNKNVLYNEKSFVGYRYYTTFGTPVEYPFGFGLSYCDFKIDNINIKRDDTYKFSIDFYIENLSKRFDGKEIVQIYLKSHNVFEPKMQLIAFSTVRIKRNEKRHCALKIFEESFTRYIANKKMFYEGNYSICVATSSENILYEEEFEFLNKEKFEITKETQLGPLLCDKKCRSLVLKEMQSVINFWAYGNVNSDRNFEDEIFLRESVFNMPMRAFTYFKDGQFDDERMDNLIKELNDIIESFD